MGGGLVRDALERLLDGEDFDKVLEEYQMDKFELLSGLRNEALSYKRNFEEEEREQLKSIYLNSCSMVDFAHKRIVFVADTHFGSKYENLNYFPMVIDFCHRNHISSIMHGGDIGAGLIECKRGFQTPLKQLDHVIEAYPEDKRVKQYILGGNHDLKYHKHGFDLLKVLAGEKKNVMPLGYSQAYFTVDGVPFSLEHHCTIRPQYRLLPDVFAIQGHAHKFRAAEDFLKLPTLSDDMHYRDFPEGNPGFVVMSSENCGDYFQFVFDRYCINSDSIKEQSRFVYQLKR